jgi:phosphoglucomutase
METQFDFGAMRKMAAGGRRMVFDAMNAVTGPYAKEIFGRRLGFGPNAVLNGLPLGDFGGAHPDPNPVHAHDLIELMGSPDAPEFGAASDGDGDRNLIVGRNCCVSPSDSLAILAANAHLVPAFREGLTGIARSMPTSLAVDRVAETLGIPAFETPTGWKYFGNLLDAGMVGLCGEESAGTGGAHVREKDGIWAVLFWLNILAVTGKSVREILTDHWHRFGRTYYARHDYEGLDAEWAQRMVDDLSMRAGGFGGTTVNGLKVISAGIFEYEDPTNGERSGNQGVKFDFSGDARLVFRLSGTGTSGATLRIYLERLETGPHCYHMDTSSALVALIEAYFEIIGVRNATMLQNPTVISY